MTQEKAKITSKKQKKTKDVVSEPKITKSDKELMVHKDKFLFNLFLFLAIVSVFNFVFYVFGNNNKKIVKNNPVVNYSLSQKQDPNLNNYSADGISFTYPKASKVQGDSNYLNIDNWGINFYSKSKDYVNFEKWFEGNFDEKNCFIKSMDSDKGTDLSYSLYFIDGVDCKNNGLYMVGTSKIGKIILGVNPDSSYEQVLASIKF